MEHQVKRVKRKGKNKEKVFINLNKSISPDKIRKKIQSNLIYVERIRNKDYKICNTCGNVFLTRNLNYCPECVSKQGRANYVKELKNGKKRNKKGNQSLLYIVYDPSTSRIAKIGETTNMYTRYSVYKCRSIKSKSDKFIRYLIKNNRYIEEFILFVFDLSVVNGSQEMIRKYIEYYLQTQIPCTVDTKRKPKDYNEDKAKEYLSKLMENSKSYQIKLDPYKTAPDNIENSYLYKFWNGSSLDNFKVRVEI